MINIDETEIRGRWLEMNGRLVKDTNTERIEALTRDYLRELKRDASGWDVLYIDPKDGRYWELSYPESDLTGGGPPLLKQISLALVKRRYGDLSENS